MAVFHDQAADAVPYSDSYPPHMVVRALRRTDRIFDVVTPSGARLAVEAGAYERPGEAAGPAPMELLLASLVTCAGSTIEAVLGKMRLEVAALNVVADAARSEDVPRVYQEILVEYHIASEAPEDRLIQSIDITERTCSASVMLAQAATMSTRLVSVKRVDPAVTRPLRQRILRPHQTVEEVGEVGEDAEGGAWFAAVTGGVVVGTVGLLPESSPDAPSVAHSTRLRAMATSEEMRGRGLGAVLLEAALSHAWATGADLVWCSARESVRDFYAAAGFVETSAVYDVEHVGPHVRMSTARP